jgi:hypothetical protein
LEYVIVFTDEELDYIIETLEKDQQNWLNWFNSLGKRLVGGSDMNKEGKKDQYENIYLPRKDVLDTIKDIRRRGY